MSSAEVRRTFKAKLRSKSGIKVTCEGEFSTAEGASLLDIMHAVEQVCQAQFPDATLLTYSTSVKKKR